VLFHSAVNERPPPWAEPARGSTKESWAYTAHLGKGQHMSIPSEKSLRIPATRNRRCPICDGDHKCSVGEDGLIMCGRKHGAAKGARDPGCGATYLGDAGGDPQFALWRLDDDPHLKDDDWRNGHHNGASNGSAPKPTVNWRLRAEALERNLTDELRRELADALGLPAAVTCCIDRLGYDPNDGCWTFPEYDGQGNVVGIKRRYRNGKKPLIAGGTHGLTITNCWSKLDGPIFLPEGASDTLALTAMGLAAIGRPTNLVGAEMLVELLRNVPAERPIIVLGEYDQKPNGTWPGVEGARKTAATLAVKLGRPIQWALPPGGAKDARAWCQSCELLASGDAEGAGREFVHGLLLNGTKPEEAVPAFGFLAEEPIDSATFAAMDCRPSWLCKGILVAEQPCVIGGPQKALKTSIGIDLAISLASGGKFLGQFPCPEPVRVMVLSGESGRATIQETANRICAARGLDLTALGDMLWWKFTLPQLSNPEHVAALRDSIVKRQIKAVFIDPLYLCLDPESAENLYKVGPALMRVSEACLSVGATPALFHHARKGAGRDGEPIELTDLAYGGITEFARQWALLSRREKYKPGTGSHHLWINVGGSVGHGGLYAVDVEEGQLAEDFTGRTWGVQVHTPSEARQGNVSAKADKKDQERLLQIRDDGTAVLNAIDKLANGDGAAVYTRVRDLAHLSNPRMTRAVDGLGACVQETEVEIRTGKNLKVKKMVKGLCRPKPASDGTDGTDGTKADLFDQSRQLTE
jgi:AAA domain